MSKNKRILFSIILVVVSSIFFIYSKAIISDEKFISYEVNLEKQDLKFYWKDDQHAIFKSILNLKKWLELKQKTLVFAMNAGMYKPDNSPQGLFIQEQNTITSLDTNSSNGNFYWKPNGVFYITKSKKAVICKTENFVANSTIQYATQSGPMLVIDGEIHPEFKQGSTKLNIRNGVGILQNGNPIFVMSKQEVSFYDFAKYFKKIGCENALYLDGFVSRTYLPEKNWIQTDGNFGVIIGVAK